MSKKSLLLVIIQFSCFIFFAFSGVLTINKVLLFIQILGFLLAVWGVLIMKIGHFNVQPELKNTTKMVTKGPYKIIRNPMYAGILLFFGMAIISNFSFARFIVYLLLVMTLLFKIFMEESFLEKRFGVIYLDYKKKTFRLLPFIKWI